GNSVALFGMHRRSQRFPAKHLKTQPFPHAERGASCVGLLRPHMSEGEFGDRKSQPDREPGWHRHRTGSQAQPGNCTALAAKAALTCSPTVNHLQRTAIPTLHTRSKHARISLCAIAT